MAPDLSVERLPRPRRVHRLLLASTLAGSVSALMAMDRGIPPATEIAACAIDNADAGFDCWKDFRVSCDQFERELSDARVVSESKWLHEFSHVAGGDRRGLITLRDGVKVRWMVRPAGSACSS